MAVAILEILLDVLLHQCGFPDTLRTLDSDEAGIPVDMIHEAPGELHGDLGDVSIVQCK